MLFCGNLLERIGRFGHVELCGRLGRSVNDRGRGIKVEVGDASSGQSVPQGFQHDLVLGDGQTELEFKELDFLSLLLVALQKGVVDLLLVVGDLSVSGVDSVVDDLQALDALLLSSRSSRA